MSGVRRFTDEQSRLLVNLRQRYEGWIEAERISGALPVERLLPCTYNMLEARTIGSLNRTHDQRSSCIFIAAPDHNFSRCEWLPVTPT